MARTGTDVTYTGSLVRSLRTIILLAVSALLAAACSGSEAGKSVAVAAVTTLPPVTVPPTTTTTSTTTTTTAPPTGPPSLLNGLPTAEDADLARRVIAVKVDNHPEARPQSGIQDAEAVIELLVEGGISRFIALFHEADTTYIGPIRSGRPTDPTLLRSLGATFQTSGGQSWVLSLINRSGVNLLGEQLPNTFRIPRGGRAFERTLYGDTTAMRTAADSRGYANDPPPGPWFSFGEPSAATGTAVEVALTWSSDWPDVRWEFDGEQYLRFNGDTPHEWVDEEDAGAQIAIDTLLVLTAELYTASPGGGDGTAVPALDTTGSGDAYLFYAGSVVEGTWERESIEDFFTLTTSDGGEMVLPPGRLWVSVFPAGRAISWE